MVLESYMNFNYSYRKDKEEYPNEWKTLEELYYHFYNKASEKMAHIINEKNNHNPIHFVITDVFVSPITFDVLVRIKAE